MQTNEDALCEEVQTEEIVMWNKWTQKPVYISVGKDNQLPGPEDYRGVGGDIDHLEQSKASTQDSNTAKLTSFLSSSSQVRNNKKAVKFLLALGLSIRFHNRNKRK